MVVRSDRTLHKSNKAYYGKNGELKRKLLRLSEGVLAVLFVTFLLFSFVIGVSRVSGESMSPTYTDGEIILYKRQFRSVAAGDVVVIRMASGENYIKRIVAVPGDTVEVTGGVLYVNGVAETASYAHGSTVLEEGTVTYPLTLQKNQYFVLGDNREHSTDSRSFGPIVFLQIIGVPFVQTQ